MIYTIGYDHMTPQELVRKMDALKIECLLDVRSVPRSRRPGFGLKQLEHLLGTYGLNGGRYCWQPKLGGRTEIEGASLLDLAILVGSIESNMMLMCKEEAPGDCHRHDKIAVPLFQRYDKSDCLHVYQDELILASELQRSLDADDEYASKPAPWAAS